MSESAASDISSTSQEGVKLTKDAPSRRDRSFDLTGVIVIIGLTFFHGAMPYAGMFYVPEININAIFVIFMGVFVLWAMPLLFYNAGRATWYNLGKRNVKEFVWERTKRLLIPFVVGVVLFSPLLPWIAFSNISVNRYETLFDWKTYFTTLYPLVFDIPLIFQNFPFIFSYILNPFRFKFFHIAHLWFLYSLFVIAIFLLPILILIRKKKNSKTLRKISRFLQIPGMIFLPAIPISLIELFTNAPLAVRYGSWCGYSFALFFLFGYLFSTDKKYKEVLRKHWVVALIISIVLFEIFLVVLLRSYLGLMAFEFSIADILISNPQGLLKFAHFMKGLSSWFWLITMLGVLDKMTRKSKKVIEKKTMESTITQKEQKRREFKTKLFKYLHRAQLPYYIIHFPVLALVAFVIVPLNIPVLIEYLILCIITLLISLGIYDIAIRRTSVTRFLFGVKEELKDTDKLHGKKVKKIQK